MHHSGRLIQQGQHLAFKASGQQKFTRLGTLGEGYSEDELRSVILGKAVHTPKAKVPYRKNPDKINLLVDIQAKLQAGKGPGYERWAKVFNLKQMAQTINFLTENNIIDYETLVEKTKAATDRYHELSQQIKNLEKRMAEITELKKHIINYSKTKDIYTAYRQSGYSAKFYESNLEDILLHQSAKRAFDSLSSEKIPSIKSLQLEYQMNLSFKKSLSIEYKSVKNTMRLSILIKNNVDLMLGSGDFVSIKSEHTL